MVVAEYRGMKFQLFPEGTDFDSIECTDGTLTADVVQDGKSVETVVIGPCPHCKDKGK